MASTSNPLERSKISWESSEAESSEPTLLSILNVRDSKAETACTRFSVATTNFPRTAPSPRTPIVTFLEPSPELPRDLRRRGTLSSPWGLFRSKSGRDTGFKRRQTVHPKAPVEQTKTRRISRWWSTNRPVSKEDKTEQRSAPPIPPRPEPLFPVTPPEANPLERSVSLHDNWRQPRVSNHQPLTPIQERPQLLSPIQERPQPLSSIQERPQPPAKEQLAELDPDKDNPEFDRIHAEGWDKVIPKQWMEDQFSQAPSETDEERSVYSQDNGEEESKRRLASQLTSAVHTHKYPAGEATPFDPQIVVQGEAASDDRSPGPDLHVRTSQEQQNRGSTRWPFEGSIVSSPMSSPVQHWLSSVSPPSGITPSSLTPGAKMETRAGTWPSHKVAAHDENSELPPPSEYSSMSQTYRKRVSSLQNHKKVRLANVRDHHLIPAPLTLRPRAPESVTTTQTQEGAISTKEGATHPVSSSLQAQGPVSLASSWSTILCTQGDSTSTLHQPTSSATPRPPTRRESDRNKPLPLPPDEPVSRRESAVETEPKTEPETQNPPRRDSLTDTIDEILDLYYYRDTASDKQDHEKSSPPPTSSFRSSSSTPTASTIQNTPKRPPRTPDTELSLASPPPPFGSNLPLPHGGTSRFVAGYPIFYDAGSYPELGHGRPAEDGERRRRRSGRAVATFVDELGGTWI
ncbi:hypothetical protein H2200_007247 [Cladophialophora chaetospira]|uniref:Uncharacterized protein n=1 Tax=Cladophialophora chaetospira TaxID=386627 RepID=A0AA38X7J9_9EURO|nr:hypothetical protein H2200_007247 [Cladophialophora chaetospira]